MLADANDASHFSIRTAKPADAGAVCHVLRRSIIKLCGEDHGGDPGKLASWLANKTPRTVRGWIGQGGLCTLVAEAGGIIGVAQMTAGGVVTLNYVSPRHRLRGVSTALMDALEARARQAGLSRCALMSTKTASRFYSSRGYGRADAGGGALSMVKEL